MRFFKIFTAAALAFGTLHGCGGSNPGQISSSSAANTSSSSSSSSTISPSSSSASSSPSVGGSVTLQELETGFCYAMGSVGDDEHNGYTGSGYVDTVNESNALIEWEVSVLNSGVYDVTVRYANGGGSGRPGTLTANGNSGAAAYFDLAATSAWTDWQEETHEIALNEGLNRLVMNAQSGDGLANIDALTIGSSDITPQNCQSSSSSSAANSSSSSSSFSSINTGNADLRSAYKEGFGAGVTGGQGGATAYASTGTQIHQAICGRAADNTPLTIMVEGVITVANTAKVSGSCNTADGVIELKEIQNISIIGTGSGALFDEIGIHVRSSSNIILQNLHIRNVKKSGSPTSNGGDAIGMESNVSRVWIDHNTLEASGGESDGYDSLIDMKAGVSDVTVSYNHLRNSSRGGLVGSSDSDDANRNITFHHNYYENIEQRTPLIRHANVHTYNNYWSNDGSMGQIHYINARMNARVLVEGNYFRNVNNPLLASDDSPEPGCWEANENTLDGYNYTRTPGNGALVIPDIVNGEFSSTCSVSVPYSYQLDNSQDVPAIVLKNAGAGVLSF